MKKAIIAIAMLPFFLAAGSKTPIASATSNTGGEPTSKEQASNLPLNSLDGLEIKSVKEDGVDPVRTNADIAAYRGRRALRMVNDDGLTATGTPAGGAGDCDREGIRFQRRHD